ELAVPDFDISDMSVDDTDMDLDQNLVVRVWVQLADSSEQAEEKVYRLAQRWAQTILALVLPVRNNAFGDGSVVSRVRGAFRINPETGQKEQVVSGCLLVLTVRSVDTA